MRILRALVAAVLAAAILAPNAAAEGERPIFVRADSMTTGAWHGYSARVQIRPAGTASGPLYVWPGGYMSDGMFVQSGVQMPGSNGSTSAWIFAWATYSTSDATSGPVPLTWIEVPNATMYSWFTFQLVRSAANDKWYFKYQDPAGAWHTQGSFAGGGRRLGSASGVVEYWSTGPDAFGTQAIQSFRVHNGTSWVLTPTSYGPPPDQCGHESVTSSTPGNLVVKAEEVPCVPWVQLW